MILKPVSKRVLRASSSILALLTVFGAPPARATSPCVTVPAGGYVNSGTVSQVCVSSTVTGGIINSGTIGSGGILFSNSGALVGGAPSVGGAIFSTGAITGGIVIGAGSSIQVNYGSESGIQISGAFSGNISNDGSITAKYGKGIQISASQIGAFSVGGGIVNTGTISGSGDGIYIRNATTFATGISNSGGERRRHRYQWFGHGRSPCWNRQ